MTRIQLRTISLRAWGAAMVLCAAALVSASVWGKDKEERAPLTCSRGPEGQMFHAIVYLPEAQPAESEFRVRIDSFSSGEVSHFGLNYLYNMQTDYLLGEGMQYVHDSARVLPNTGTANVRDGARAWHDAYGIHMLLPAHVKNGTSYTPPSLEFRVRVTAEAGQELRLLFNHYHVAANALLVGTVHTDCDPKPKPYVIGRVKVLSANSG